jgi:hypothetical protein
MGTVAHIGMWPRGVAGCCWTCLCAAAGLEGLGWGYVPKSDEAASNTLLLLGLM